MTGYLKKIVLISSILLFVFLFFPTLTSAQSTLDTNAVFSHNIKDNGLIETTLTFTISSKDRTVLSYYTITIPETDIDPEIFSISRSRSLEATVYDRTDSTDILIDLENSVIPEDGNTKLTISYTHRYSDENILDLVSKVADTNTSSVTISYPRSWGESSWISDQIEDIKQSDNSYILSISDPDSSTIKLIFGQDIAYNFNISRSLNNPSDISNQYEIVIPMDTQFQKVIINEINHKPTQSIIDNNGNYILIYTLDPQSQVDVKISGSILMEMHDYYHSEFSTNYDNRDIYWSLEDRQLEKVDEYLTENGVTDPNDKENIAKYLYKYVIETLEHSTSATTLSGGVRKGAIEVLKSPSEASPEDYADVLRALLSYYEIPAIYTIGFVSDISSYQDQGMFHYWLQTNIGNRWVVLDPYLEDFSNVSLWGREQLDHIAILNRTQDSISPTLTYYSDNDISFTYISDNEIVYSPDSNMSISLEPYSILNKYMYGNINIENTGNTIFTSTELTDSQPNLSEYVDTVTSSSNSILLPHDNRTLNFHIPFNKLQEEIIFTTVNLKNGIKTVDSELVSTEYSISERTGYEVVIKLISIMLFVLTFFGIYILINKFVYRQ
jgi:hypothetical protein